LREVKRGLGLKGEYIPVKPSRAERKKNLEDTLTAAAFSCSLENYVFFIPPTAPFLPANIFVFPKTLGPMGPRGSCVVAG
jgi:hypothetical protein